VPNHIVVDRDNLGEGREDPDGFVETEDYVELRGTLLPQPLSNPVHWKCRDVSSKEAR